MNFFYAYIIDIEVNASRALVNTNITTATAIEGIICIKIQGVVTFTTSETIGPVSSCDGVIAPFSLEDVISGTA